MPGMGGGGTTGKERPQCMYTWGRKQGGRNSLSFGICHLASDYLCKLNIILGFAGLKKKWR